MILQPNSVNKFLGTKIYNIFLYIRKVYKFLQENNKYRFFLGFISVFFVGFVVYILKSKSYLHGDDYIYSYIFTTFDRITNISDIITSQEIHYQVWGGRSVVHFILQLVLMLPPLAINILNTIMFLLLIISIYYHIKGRGRNSIILFLGIFFCVWILQPVFGDTVFWITGSVNYLWGTVIILLFLLPYRFYEGKHLKNIITALFAVLAFIFGIVAGWTNENTAAALIVMIVLFLLYYKQRGWRMPVWSLAGLVGIVIGFAIMIAAPGNYARAGEASVSLMKVLFNIFAATQSFIGYLGGLNLLLVILYILYYKYVAKGRMATSFLTFIYLSGTLISIYSMVLSPTFAPRSWFGIICLNIIAIGIIFYNLNSEYDFVKLIKLSFLLLGIGMFCSTFYDALKDVKDGEAKRAVQNQIISEGRKSKADFVEIERVVPKTKFGLYDAPYALDYMSDFYGVKIVFKKECK